MSRQELAEAVNAHLFEHAGREFSIDASHIGRLERGEHRWPSAHYRTALCAVLGAERDAGLGFYINRAPEEAPEPDPAPAVLPCCAEVETSRRCSRVSERMDSA
jgi:hypothetical protein